MQKYNFSLKQTKNLITIWLFGKFLFGCLASFYLVVWQVFIWLFGKFLLGYLVSIHLVIFHPDGRWHSRRIQHPQGHHRRDLQGRRQLPPPVTKKDIPRPSSRKAESGDAHILTVLNGSPVETVTKPCTTQQGPSN